MKDIQPDRDGGENVERAPPAQSSEEAKELGKVGPHGPNSNERQSQQEAAALLRGQSNVSITASMAPPGKIGDELLNSTSVKAINASIQSPDTAIAETGETEGIINSAQSQTDALGNKPAVDEAAGWGENLPPSEDGAFIDADELTFRGMKLLAGWDLLMEEADKPVDRVIGPFEAETLSIATGEPGRGKSLLGLTLGVAVAGGKEFGGLKPPRPQPVLIFSPEDKLRVIGARIKAAVEELGADPATVKHNLRVFQVPDSSVIFEGVGETLDFNPLGVMLRRVIKAMGARFIVIDPFIEIHTGDENSNMQIHALMAMLRTLARKTQSAIFLTHHSAKGGQGPRGASAFLGTVRAGLHVEGLDKEELKAAAVQGLKPSRLFKVAVLKNSYEEVGEIIFFQRISIRPGEAPVLRRVFLE